ncbi:MAG: DEAD/DEAH box helicase [Bacteroidota bacterium]
MQLQPLAKLAADYVNSTNRHIFLTGKAGTGKTTFLRYISQHTFKRTVVAAPTGIAAINAGGVTLHSLLHLPFGAFIPERLAFHNETTRVTTPDTLLRNSKFNASKRNLIREMELLIIDEVSMLRADLLDCIDHMLQYLRRNRSPFGGVQILFIGDLLQLPPVIKDEEKSLLQHYYTSFYFFESRALKKHPPIHVELQKIFRQQDQEFIDLLNRLRTDSPTIEDLNFLNRFYDPEVSQSDETGYIHLTTHNYKADQLNKQKLNLLEGEILTFSAQIDGTFPDSMFPTSPELHLKTGAQVMFIKNDPSGEGRFFNGKIGLVRIAEGKVFVKFEDGDEVEVSPYKWENIRYVLNEESNEIEERYVGGFEQYPIKLAWAVTVHKSQGLTFEKAILDLSGTFAPGQLYVALSRLTSLKGLSLSSPLPEKTPAIDVALGEFNALKVSESSLKEGLVAERKVFLADLGKVVFDFTSLIFILRNHQQGFSEKESRSIKKQNEAWTNALVEETAPLQTVGAGFIREVNRILQEEDYLNHFSERLSKAESYFTDQLTPLA